MRLYQKLFLRRRSRVADESQEHGGVCGGERDFPAYGFQDDWLVIGLFSAAKQTGMWVGNGPGC